jgi:carboxypeptidase C (cathepsin A)
VLRAAGLLLGLWILPAAGADPANRTALWWNPAEAGWGINVVHQGDIAFASLFTYDAAGQPLWLVMSRGERQPAGDAFSGPLYRTTGPAFNAVPFTPITGANVVPVGTMRMEFSGLDSATLEYDVDGIRVTKSIRRFVYGARAAQCHFVQGSRAGARNYQDLWWNAAESGWGVNIVHQGDVLFASLFTYGANNRPLWLVMSAGARQADGSYLGDLYRGTGSPFNAQPFNAPVLTRVGTMRLRFASGESGTLEYTVDGANVVKAITRQVYASPVSLCEDSGPAAPYHDPVVYSVAPGEALASAQEAAAIARGRLMIGAEAIDYTATTGHLTAIDLASGTPAASFFYVAYTADGGDPSTRPVTFIYNGGPGYSTTYLHLGSFGPKRLATGMPNISTFQSSFPLVDNAESLLDVSDLVFVDAVGTGYSQAIAPYTNRTFWGVDTDAAVFRDFVRRYVAVNGRDASPKYVFGESYGTTRSAILARLLESAGTRVSGVILQSSILDYNANCQSSSARCTSFIPSFAAVAAWFGRVPDPGAAGLPAFLTQVRALALDRYDPALRDYLATRAPPSVVLLNDLSNATGLPVSDWQAHFDLTASYYGSRLLPGLILGRYDARVTVAAGSELARFGDPSSSFISDGFDSGINDYLVTGLGYTTPSTYAIRSSTAWSYSHGANARPDTIPDLAAAFAMNPALRVLSLNGYYDLATPFLQTERDLARLGANPNVFIRRYAGGHMTYLDDAARRQQKADLAAFYRGAVTFGNAKARMPGSMDLPTTTH